ncbi:hypothetical protein [Arcobacter arenosus]|jgi:hypothetical protein|uniref:Transformation system protein n=1 Tax=Arcobacter arenosus TaxID=2576037 RepID=A0A5R8XYS5_9BACT|nr:hypothetical protein [Arcobacter arenosus]TLP36922.1 hypothetical protein FDK22_11795 [Arcobacter arenosus]
MQHLKYIENSFELLPLRVKVVIYLFPFTILCLIYLYFLEIKRPIDRTPSLVNIEKIQMKVKLIDVLKDIENFAFKNEIYLNKITKGDSSLDFIANSDLKKRLSLLIYLEKYNSFSKIKSFQMSDENLKVSIDFKKFYKKEEIDLIKELEKFKEKKKQVYNLKAIIGQKAFINNKWFSLNDKIERFEIKKINKTNVLMENKFKKISLNLQEKN